MEYWPRKSERGQSELLGTVLIFSLVILIGVALVGVGAVLFEDAEQEFDDRQGQDAMQEIDDRLAGAQDGTILELPDRTADQIEARSDEGRVTVTVTTLNESVGNVEISPATIRADNMSSQADIDIGTIVHETSDGGVETVYQGGMLFERTAAGVQIISEPSFDHRLGTQTATLELGFTGITSFDELGTNRELFVERDEQASATASEKIEELVLRHRQFEGEQAFQLTAGIAVDVTIETEYPEAWATYGAERMTDPPESIRVPAGLDDQSVPDDDRIESADIPENTVEFEFPPFEGSDPGTVDFPNETLYSGIPALAPLFYNGEAGTITSLEDGFEVNEVTAGESAVIHNEEYFIAFADEEHNRWLLFDSRDANQGNVENQGWVDVSLDEQVSGPTDTPDEVLEFKGGGGADSDEWEFASGTTICMVVNEPPLGQVELSDFAETIAEGDCNELTLGDSTPPSVSSDLEIEDAVVTDEPAGDNRVFSDESGAVDEAAVFEDAYVNVRVNNTGPGLANESFVGVEATVGGERRLVASDRVTLYPFENPDGDSSGGALPDGFDTDQPHDLVMEFQIPEGIEDSDDLTVFTAEDSLDREIEIEGELENKSLSPVSVDSFTTNETVQVLDGEGVVTNVTISVDDDAERDLDDIFVDEGETRELVLSADGRIVDTLAIDESRLEIAQSGDEAAVTADITWVPLPEDVGPTDLELAVAGPGDRTVGETTVVPPAQAFFASETLPVDVDIDIITGG